MKNANESARLFDFDPIMSIVVPLNQVGLENSQPRIVGKEPQLKWKERNSFIPIMSSLNPLDSASTRPYPPLPLYSDQTQNISSIDFSFPRPCSSAWILDTSISEAYHFLLAHRVLQEDDCAAMAVDGCTDARLKRPRVEMCNYDAASRKIAMPDGCAASLSRQSRATPNSSA